MLPEDKEWTKRIEKGRAIASAINFKNKAEFPSGVIVHFGGKCFSDFNTFLQVNVTESNHACTGAG